MHGPRIILAAGLGLAAAAPITAAADDELPDVAIHGFVSQGAFASTANNYLGYSRRGTFELTEAGLNASSEVAERLRVGLQLFTRDVGFLGDYKMTLDWAYLDYRWRDWLGLRAGRIKMPFGLHNEYSDVDAARLPILLPQSLYPVENRDFLLAQTGFAAYGHHRTGAAGQLDYQLFGGTIFLDSGEAAGVNEVDTRYVVGGQLFWTTPVDGLRVGASMLHGDIRFAFQLDDATVEQLVMAGLVPMDFDGEVTLRIRPFDLVVGSAEYVRGRWMVSAEYSRWMTHTESSVPGLLPRSDDDAERLYAMVSCRVSDRFEAGAYYSLHFVDAGDRGGEDARFARPELAFQKDLALSLRYDVNDAWLWKLEGHYIDGAADLRADHNPDPTRRWGLALVKTTVSF